MLKAYGGVGMKVVTEYTKAVMQECLTPDDWVKPVTVNS